MLFLPSMNWRLTFTGVHPDKTKDQAVTFSTRAVAYFANLESKVRRLLTDNGSAFRSRAFTAACDAFDIKRSLPGASDYKSSQNELSRHWALASGRTAGRSRTPRIEAKCSPAGSVANQCHRPSRRHPRPLADLQAQLFNERSLDASHLAKAF
jgi:transposase InsO family protein